MVAATRRNKKFSHLYQPDCSSQPATMASFFSGLANQAQGLIAEKMGKNPAEGGEVPPEGEVPVEGTENGEVPPEGGAMGGAMGFMGGIMQKANAVKGAVAEKAGGLGAGNLQVSIMLIPHSSLKLE